VPAESWGQLMIKQGRMTGQRLPDVVRAALPAAAGVGAIDDWDSFANVDDTYWTGASNVAGSSVAVGVIVSSLPVPPPLP
jgi:hypothetical protein